jgi:anti-sigma B factor antagonist
MTQMPSVDITIESSEDEVRLTLTGDIDLAGVAALERARAKALDGHPDSMLIDLRGVNFVDSSGLRFLLQTERAARSHGCTLRLLRPADSAMQVFVVTGAERHLPFVDDETA